MTSEILSIYIVRELAQNVNEYIYGPPKYNRVVNEFKELFYSFVFKDKDYDYGCVCLRRLTVDSFDYVIANWRTRSQLQGPEGPKSVGSLIMNFRKVLYKLNVNFQKGPDKDHFRTGFKYIK